MTNFLQFDPIKNNMQSDSLYQASSFRAQGAQTGIASASGHNKLFYQLSTMVAGLAQMMEAKGYTIDDADIATLVTELAHIMTEADMSDYALVSALEGYIAKSAVVIKTASYVLATTDFYKTFEANSASSVTFTLPAYSALANGAWIKIKNIGAGTLTISGVIDGVSPSTDLAQWDEIVIFTDGTGYRGKVISASSAGDWDGSLTTNGYQKFPGGLTIQWGEATVTILGGGAGGETTITFPTPFSNAILGVQLTHQQDQAYGGSGANYYKDLTVTNMTVGIDYVGGIGDTPPASYTMKWMAYGY